MDVWMQVGNKFSNVENDLRSVSRQLALLQDFIRLKFQAEFNAFMEATEDVEVSGNNAFGNGDTAAAATSTAQEINHIQRREGSSTKMNFIAPSVSVRRVRAAPSLTNKPMSSSVSMISPVGSVDAYYQVGEIIDENVVEQAHYSTNSGGFEAEDAHEFLPTVLEAPEIIDEKFEPPQDVIGLDDDDDDDGVEDPLGSGTSALSRGGYERYEQLESKSSARQTTRRITSIPSRYLEGTAQRQRGRRDCWKCHKTFKTSGHLRRHEMTHLSIKPFKCNYCPKRFTRTDHLKVHIKSHEKLAHTVLHGKSSKK